MTRKKRLTGLEAAVSPVEPERHRVIFSCPEADVVIVGDQSYTLAEWEALRDPTIKRLNAVDLILKAGDHDT